jgi:hypothetical protein
MYNMAAAPHVTTPRCPTAAAGSSEAVSVKKTNGKSTSQSTFTCSRQEKNGKKESSSPPPPSSSAPPLGGNVAAEKSKGS